MSSEQKVTIGANKETIKGTFENSPWRNLCRNQRRQERRKAIFTFFMLLMASKSAVAVLRGNCKNNKIQIKNSSKESTVIIGNCPQGNVHFSKYMPNINLPCFFLVKEYVYKLFRSCCSGLKTCFTQANQPILNIRWQLQRYGWYCSTVGSPKITL